jgi:hypothetical protein
MAADDVDGLFAAKLSVHLPEQIDEGGVNFNLRVLSPVAHKPVDLLERIIDEPSVLLVGDGERFFGVDVIQRDRARAAWHGNRLGCGNTCPEQSKN